MRSPVRDRQPVYFSTVTGKKSEISPKGVDNLQRKTVI